jgi:hypothetical protein
VRTQHRADANEGVNLRTFVASRQSTRERHVKQLSCPTFRGFAPSIIPRGRRHIGVTREALHRSEIRSGVEKMGDERAAKIVRSESLYPGLGCSLPEYVEHRLVRHPARGHSARGVHRIPG